MIGALEGTYITHTLGEVVAEGLKMVAGMFIGGGFGGTKSLVEKSLSWHIPTLQAANSGGTYKWKHGISCR